ncbi:MAG: amidophosphoribosyltransferase [Clostridiales bacterium]|jgi:amidophosphoribosyltransferase|nr:amidophosphoribosyltransferase [Clostridiales bacterium]
MTDKVNEECAVAGVSIGVEESAGLIYNALLALQHRGQEGAGIAVLRENRITVVKKRGLVSEVFAKEVLESMPKSKLAIGHTRYSTTGSNTVENVQPFVSHYLTGRIAIAHNGNIINAKQLKEQLRELGVDFNATSDTEVISSLIAYHIVRLNDEVAGIREAVKLIEGAFTLILMTGRGKLVLVRDGYGFRPLCIGRNSYGIMAASESVALDCCGFQFERDVEPGEMVVIEKGEITSSERVIETKKTGVCIFEYVYFARSDSIIDGQSVYKARFNMGVQMAKELPHIDADFVAGVPDSGLDCAAGYAYGSGLPLVSAFVKNRYVGRSFIYPSQLEREHAVSIKLNPLKANVEGKRIILAEDSIVRGTTCAKTVKALKAAGAKEVHMRISSPPFRHSCYFGTDVDKPENLIANQHSIQEIADQIGVDSLAYISIEGMKKACSDSRLDFCTGCFTGSYNIDIDEYDKAILEEEKCSGIEK